MASVCEDLRHRIWELGIIMEKAARSRKALPQCKVTCIVSSTIAAALLTLIYSPILGQISGWFKLLAASADRFRSVEVDHGGRLSAMGSVRTADGGLCLRSGPSVQVAHSYVRDRHRRSMKTLSMHRPLSSIEIRVPTRFRRSVQPKDVNGLP